MNDNYMEAEKAISDDELEIAMPDPMVRPIPVQEREREMAQPERPATPLPFIFDGERYPFPATEVGFFQPIRDDHGLVIRHPRYCHRNSFPYNTHRINKPIAIRADERMLAATGNRNHTATGLTSKAPKNSEDERFVTMNATKYQECYATTSTAPVSDSLPPMKPLPNDDAMRDLVQEIRAWCLSKGEDTI